MKLWELYIAIAGSNEAINSDLWSSSFKWYYIKRKCWKVFSNNPKDGKTLKLDVFLILNKFCYLYMSMFHMLIFICFILAFCYLFIDLIFL